MNGESLPIKPAYLALAKELLDHFGIVGSDKRLVLTVWGESGSGKSTVAMCFKKLLESKGKCTVVLGMDGYFHLPPTVNAQKRREDLSWVGPGEIDFGKVEEVLQAFKTGHTGVSIQRVDYEKDRFFSEQVNLAHADVLVVEGCYAFHVEEADIRICMERTYKQTRQRRQARTREVYDPFVEQVLAVEHRLIAGNKHLADARVDPNNRVVLP